ncbi:MAG TPA: DedA family protein [Gemmatimonadales bacterium]|nr:DedA family protein [Gemmatimonadales bacterium]
MQDLILDAVQTLGPVGVGILMLLENLFPPLPSELIMPLAGYLAARGDVSLPGSLVGGTVGSVLGAVAWYAVGRRVPRDALLSWVDAHGRWLTICSPDVERAERFFKRHGRSSVLLGRLVPVVRTLISLPAGLGRMPATPFLLFSTVGTAIWTTGLGLAGMALGSQFPAVDRYVGWVSWAVIGGALVWYLVRVFRPRSGGARRDRQR